MLLWVTLATVGQLINAIVVFMDKFLVTDEKALPKPFVYAFYTCLLTGFWVLIYIFGYLPFFSDYGMPSIENVQKPSIQVLGMSFLAAYTFFMALVSMYTALKKAEADNVIPVIGTVSALSTFGMSYLFLNITLSANFIWGIVILSLGTLLVAQTLPKKETILNVIHSGVFFGLHFITMKGLFLETSFDDGFFWSRLSFVLFALSLLLVPVYFEKINSQTKETSPETGYLVILTKVLAGVAAFLILKATDLGDVSVVQALDGLKFVFILIISIVFGAMLPNSIVGHKVGGKQLFRRFLYVIIILVGYFVLFL